MSQGIDKGVVKAIADFVRQSDEKQLKLEIERPSLSFDASIFGLASSQARGNKEFEVALAYLTNAVDDAMDIFQKEAQSILSRLVKASNDQLVASLAESDKAPDELLELCTPELAMSVMLHRNRALKRQLADLKEVSDAKIYGPNQTVEQALDEVIEPMAA